MTFIVVAGLAVLLLGGALIVVVPALMVDADYVPGFEPSSAAMCPPRSSRRDRPVDLEAALPAAPSPGRASSRSASDGAVSGGAPNLARDRIVGLDDGQLRHGFEWRERERELRGEQ